MTGTLQALETAAGVASNDWKPYPAYKDSGVPWLGRVPDGWEVRRIKTVLQERDVRPRDSSIPLLSLTRSRGLIPYGDRTERVHSAKSLVAYKLYRPGQIVMNRMQAWSGMFGASQMDGLVSPDYAVFEVLGSHRTALLLERLKAPDLVGQFALESKGIGSGFNRLYGDRFGATPISLPPTAEQDAIVRFLDYHDRLIRKYIRTKQKLIALLTEQKQAIIQHAVTRGLNPDVKLKSSGVAWLGDIPEHWEMKPNRSFLEVRKVLVGSRHEEYQLLSLTKRGVVVRDLSEMKGKFSSDIGTSQEVRPGDLVFCLFDVPETPRTVGLSRHRGMITSAYTVMECSDPEIAMFLEAFYIAMDDRKLLSPLYSGLRNTIPKGRLLSAKTPVPPPEERDAILMHIDRETAPLESAVNRFSRQIALMREYRTRLTADVVTGKIDVREAAAALPAVEDAPPIADTDLEEPTDAEEALDVAE